MFHHFGRAFAVFGALAISSVILASCATSPEAKLSKMTLDPSRDALLILETSAIVNLGITDSDPYVLKQYNASSGKPEPSGASFEIVGTGGRFVVAQAPAGFHVVQAYDGLSGLFCYDVQSYGVTVKPGDVVLIGKLDLAQTQKDAEATEQAFIRSASVPKDSPQARDRIVFELTRNFSVVDRVTIKRELFAKAIETPFAIYEGGVNPSFAVVRRKFLTSMEAPRLTKTTDESLVAAKDFIRTRRPDLADRVEHAELTPVSLVPSDETCAPGSIAPR